MDLVPEVVGAPSPQGVVIVPANNLPPDDTRHNRDAWYVPAHVPLFLNNDPARADRHGVADQYGVANVTAMAPKNIGRVVGVSIDGI